MPADYGVEALIEDSDITIFASMLRYGDQQSYQQYLQSHIAASKLPISERQTGNRRQFNQIFIDSPAARIRKKRRFDYMISKMDVNKPDLSIFPGWMI